MTLTRNTIQSTGPAMPVTTSKHTQSHRATRVSSRPATRLQGISTVVLTLLVFAACGPGSPIENPQMCQKLENDVCPQGLDMFLRTRPELYVSGEASVEGGEKITIDILNVSDPENPRDFFDTSYTVEESGETVTVPMRPGRLPAGSYHMLIGRASQPETPPTTLLFSVWNTQAEIDARRELGDRTGAIITSVRICKEPVDDNCEESFHTIEGGTQRLHYSMRYDDALDGTTINIQWLRNGRAMSSSARDLTSGSGTMYGWVGYENANVDPGKYTLLITATKSKQGQLRKEVQVK